MQITYPPWASFRRSCNDEVVVWKPSISISFCDKCPMAWVKQYVEVLIIQWNVVTGGRDWWEGW